MLPHGLPNASAATPPDQLKLTGLVRDFHKTHPDFNVSPAGSSGHYVRNLANQLLAGVPVYVGGGSKVQTEWKDSAGRNIGPTMFNRFAATN